jgi:hypothetical protein
VPLVEGFLEREVPPPLVQALLGDVFLRQQLVGPEHTEKLQALVLPLRAIFPRVFLPLVVAPLLAVLLGVLPPPACFLPRVFGLASGLLLGSFLCGLSSLFLFSSRTRLLFSLSARRLLTLCYTFLHCIKLSPCFCFGHFPSLLLGGMLLQFFF